MKTRMVLLALVAAIAPPAGADEAHRIEMTLAAGACAPTVPSDPLRYRVGSARNAGSAPMYVFCGITGDWRDEAVHNGSYHAGVEVANTGNAAVEVECVLHSGYSATSTTTSQGTKTMATQVPAGSTMGFAFAPEVGQELATPNFVCKLPPKVEIRYVYTEYYEAVSLPE